MRGPLFFCARCEAQTNSGVRTMSQSNTIADFASFMTPREASKFLRKSTATLATWRSRGRISKDGLGGPPFYRVGRSIRYRATDLLAFAETSGPLVNTAQRNPDQP